jgi:hypothetical protein
MLKKGGPVLWQGSGQARPVAGLPEEQRPAAREPGGSSPASATCAVSGPPYPPGPRRNRLSELRPHPFMGQQNTPTSSSSRRGRRLREQRAATLGDFLRYVRQTCRRRSPRKRRPSRERGGDTVKLMTITTRPKAWSFPSLHPRSSPPLPR